VEKFKQFYVRVTKSQKKSNIEKAIRQIYGTEPKELENQWHEYINLENDA
jgi:ribosomal protein L23